MFQNFDELRKSVKTSVPKTMVVAAAHDEHTLEAVYSAAQVLPMKYRLVGDADKIVNISGKLGVNLDKQAIVECTDYQDCAKKAVELIRENQGNLLMKGILETGTLLKAVLDQETGIRGTGTISHLAMLEVPSYHKLISVTDAGMIPYPTLEQKADIIENAISFYEKMGFTQLKIAALTASEAESKQMPETADAAALKKMNLNNRFGESTIEGPISFDIAISPNAAAIKKYSSEITGDVDVLLVPNIAAGNILCKGLLYWGGAKMAGCVLGAKVPIILVSRGASTEEKLLSIMLCLKAG